MEELMLKMDKEDALLLFTHLTQTADDTPSDDVARVIRETTEKLKVFLLKGK